MVVRSVRSVLGTAVATGTLLLGAVGCGGTGHAFTPVFHPTGSDSASGAPSGQPSSDGPSASATGSATTPPAGSARFTISPDPVASGDQVTIDGEGFQSYATAVHGIAFDTFDANNKLVASFEAKPTADGRFHVTGTTAGLSPGQYSMTLFYTYWGASHDPTTGEVICDFCPVKTEYVAGPAHFTVT